MEDFEADFDISWQQGFIILTDVYQYVTNLVSLSRYTEFVLGNIGLYLVNLVHL